MWFLDLTLPTPAENLALDEALLETAEANERPCEVLRLWESPTKAVILGRSSAVGVEANRAYCDQHSIPILRRCSGGASVVIGPGCLMYGVVLSYELRPHLQMIEQAHRFVMQALTDAIQPFVPAVTFNGTCDGTFHGRKFSGNALRCKRTHLLYHGTLLYNFPVAEIGGCLGTPPRQPDYRAGRSHDEFVTNLPISGEQLREVVTRSWKAETALVEWPREMTERLAGERYAKEEWNFRL